MRASHLCNSDLQDQFSLTMAASPSGVSRQLLASAQGDGRVVAWAKQIDNLDMKEVELQASQTKVLRDQVTALVHELTAVCQDLSSLRS